MDRLHLHVFVNAVQDFFVPTGGGFPIDPQDVIDQSLLLVMVFQNALPLTCFGSQLSFN